MYTLNGGRLAKWFLKGSRRAVLVSVVLRMVEKVMYVLWNGVREKTKNARERELCFRIPDSKIYISRETEEKKKIIF